MRTWSVHMENVLHSDRCMGAFTIGNKLREELTDAFLTNEFVPGCSSQPKVDAFREYEAAHQK